MTVPSMIVYLDYVCPYCLLAEDTITTTAAEYGVEVDWRPFELRPAPSPTLHPEDDHLPRVWRQSSRRRSACPVASWSASFA